MQHRIFPALICTGFASLFCCTASVCAESSVKASGDFNADTTYEDGGKTSKGQAEFSAERHGKQYEGHSEGTYRKRDDGKIQASGSIEIDPGALTSFFKKKKKKSSKQVTENKPIKTQQQNTSNTASHRQAPRRSRNNNSNYYYR